MSTRVHVGVHGNVAQVEPGEGLDPAEFTVTRRGWGTVVTDNDLPHVPDAAVQVWIHLPIPTPINLENVTIKIESVLPVTTVTEGSVIAALHVWDGGRRLKHWDSVDDVAFARTVAGWPVEEPVETGVGISMMWLPSAPLDSQAPLPELTIFGARAWFDRAFDETSPLHPL